MTDADLLVLGCVVSFIAACGAYVFVRGRFTQAPPRLQEVPVQHVRRGPRRVA